MSSNPASSFFPLPIAMPMFGAAMAGKSSDANIRAIDYDQPAKVTRLDKFTKPLQLRDLRALVNKVCHCVVNHTHGLLHFLPHLSHLSALIPLPASTRQMKEDTLRDEFRDLPLNVAQNADPEIEQYMKHNRDPRILPNSHTRIKLNTLPRSRIPPYIHANSVRGADGNPMRFIATQVRLAANVSTWLRCPSPSPPFSPL